MCAFGWIVAVLLLGAGIYFGYKKLGNGRASKF